MPGKIYLVSLNGVPKYVGFTTNSIETRWKQHCRDSKPKKISNRPLLHAIKKYGAEAFEILEIYSNEDEKHTLMVMEETFIRQHKTHVSQGGYNVTYGGQGPDQTTKEKIKQGKLGTKLKPESIKKRQKTWLERGYNVMTKAQKQKISNTLKGHPISQQSKQLMSARAKERWKTYVVSNETKEKLRQAALKRWGKVV